MGKNAQRRRRERHQDRHRHQSERAVVALPVVSYTRCDACGSSGISVGEDHGPGMAALFREQLRRCPDCGAGGRHVETRAGRPDPAAWPPEVVQFYDDILAGRVQLHG